MYFFLFISVCEPADILFYSYDSSFHYDVFLHEFPEARLLFNDTDSLYYYIEHPDLEAGLAEIKNHLDYSEYDPSSPHYDKKNEKVLGKFKCETQGKPIIEFVGLRPKMYSILYKDKTSTTMEKHRAKGISKSARRDLKHEEYKKQLDLPSENYITNRRLGSKLHKIYAVAVEKRGLCSFDDKRFILDDKIHTLAYGHKNITKEIVTDDIQNPGGDTIMTEREARLRG